MGSCVRSALLGIVMGCAAMCASGAQTPQGASARVNVIDDQQRVIGLAGTVLGQHPLDLVGTHQTALLQTRRAEALGQQRLQLRPEVREVVAFPERRPGQHKQQEARFDIEDHQQKTTQQNGYPPDARDSRAIRIGRSP